MSMQHLAVRGLALLLETSLRSLPLLAVAGIALLCLRRASAAARHLVLLLILVSLLLMPLLSSTLPGWQMRLWPRTVAFMPLAATAPQTPGMMPPWANPPANSPVLPSAPEEGPGPGQDALPSSTTHHRQRQISWALIGFSLWLIGVIAVLTPVMAGLACLRRIGRQSHLVTLGAVTDLADELAQQLGLRRLVQLRQSEADNTLGVPMTWGWRRPVILLPAGTDVWSEDRLRVVLLHELAHIRRNDWLWQMLAHVTCALYWFHPGVWLAARGLRAESERACDDQVLSAGVPAMDYARHLVDVARTLSQRNILPDVVLPMATPPITGRLEAVLQKGKVRSMMTRKNCLMAGLLAAAILAPLAALRPAAYAQQPRHDISPRPRWETKLLEKIRRDNVKTSAEVNKINTASEIAMRRELVHDSQLLDRRGIHGYEKQTMLSEDETRLRRKMPWIVTLPPLTSKRYSRPTIGTTTVPKLQPTTLTIL
jgi:beta-lactamase regulating signal transducer with metallopeptidase domain